MIEDYMNNPPKPKNLKKPKETKAAFRTLRLSEIRHRYKVYLAGPITGLDYDGCIEWRDYVIQNLPVEIAGYSPMRHKSYLSNVENLKGSYEDWPLSTQRGLFTRDFNDCKTSDAILINFLGATIVSIGTVMEIAWGYALRIPIILIMEPKSNIHEHPMILEACPFRTSTIDEAIDVISAILLPSAH